MISAQAIGRLTENPVLRSTQGGTSTVSLRIACTKWRDSDKADFLDVDLYGTSADNAAKYLIKGQKVTVMGHLEQQNWDDKETGKPRSKMVLISDRITYCERPKGASNAPDTTTEEVADQPEPN